jgi:hypothetical protein
MKARTILMLLLAVAVAGAQTAPPSQKVAPAGKRAKPARKAASHARGAAKPATAQAKAAPTVPAGKRDPFVSVVVGAGPGGLAATCVTGKKCLQVSSIVLRGIVKAPSGMIAVVESSARRVTYFLRENDPIFNGYVLKITGDSVVFRENVLDTLGRTTTRDVVKRVQAPAV